MLNRRRFIASVPAFAAASILPADAATENDDPFPLPKLDVSKVPKQFQRTIVNYQSKQWPGTIIVDTGERHLYVILQGGKAIRYGIAVGRDGFRWAGVADIGRKVMWPRWTPPPEMIARDAKFAKWKNGMPGGPENPLGARALYLFRDSRDTLYRIHGTNAPQSIGTAASSGCIRMFNQDIVDLYRRAPVGTRVLVYSDQV
jgi:lipoprotein-anchoring transpeptidase ErfK/SrfK